MASRRPCGPARPLPAYAVNLDIFGYGDTFFAVASNPTGVLASVFQRSEAPGGLPVRLVSPAQYPTSDHNSMINAGIETLGIALLDGKEIDTLTDGKQLATSPPRILTLIHTPRDAMDAFRADDVARAAATVERFLRLLDERRRSSRPVQRWPRISEALMTPITRRQAMCTLVAWLLGARLAAAAQFSPRTKVILGGLRPGR